MSENQHVYSTLLRRMLKIYGAPKVADVEAHLAEYARALSEFEKTELDQAADDLAASNKVWAWPVVGECVAACEAARVKLQRSQGVPDASIAGTGWRLSDSGRRWFQIEKGDPEFRSWMQFYRENKRHKLANVCEKVGRTFVLGSSPSQHGTAMLTWLDANRAFTQDAA